MQPPQVLGQSASRVQRVSPQPSIGSCAEATHIGAAGASPREATDGSSATTPSARTDAAKNAESVRRMATSETEPPKGGGIRRAGQPRERSLPRSVAVAAEARR
jgi:hypothetical protein